MKKEKKIARNIQTKHAIVAHTKKKKPASHLQRKRKQGHSCNIFFFLSPNKQPRLRVHISARINSSFGERIQADLEPFHNLVQHLGVVL